MKQKIEYIRYKCSCGWKVKQVYTGWYPTIPCPKCGGAARMVIRLPKTNYDPDKRYKPLTEQQKRLIHFYRAGEKVWHADIRSRHVDPSTGKIVRIPEGKPIPWLRQ